MSPHTARKIYERMEERESIQREKTSIRYPKNAYVARWLAVNFESVLAIRFLREARLIPTVGWNAIVRYAGIETHYWTLRLAFAEQFMERCQRGTLPNYRRLLDLKDSIEYIFCLTSDESKGRILFDLPKLVYPLGLVLRERKRGILPSSPKEELFMDKAHRIHDEEIPKPKVQIAPLFVDVKSMSDDELVMTPHGKKKGSRLFADPIHLDEEDSYSPEAMELIRKAREKEAS